MSNEEKQAVYLSARERAAIIGGLILLSEHAWKDELSSEPIEVGDILDVATECSRFEMLDPEKIDALCKWVAGQ